MDTMATNAEVGNEENTEKAPEARVDPDASNDSASDMKNPVNEPQTRV